MKLTTEYYEDKNKGQYVNADDESMVPFLEKLIELTHSDYFKIYYRSWHSYRDNCDMIYIYAIMPELKHELTIANNCGADRRIWMQHHFQRSIGEDVRPIEIMSEKQIEVFDRLYDTWIEHGTDVTHSDAAVAEEIMKL